MRPFVKVLFILAMISVVFFVSSAIVMGTWNFAIPRLINSVDGSNTFTNIGYDTAMVFTILVFTLFGGSMMTPSTIYLMDCRKESGVQQVKTKESSRKPMNQYSMEQSWA